eukprot:CAMPEP_0114549004 /NCGR_PEP_ID=MMETSP0114-20121206/5290_1 /TAXON_ID=31324 /ORGANISM="Goniomonas sp, Strain m" /LENGTH=227 /DNA_ID=CAMNT_0001733645 /DNA_START=35 /DNA_END=718 /DNA_ORIENTATION=-
MAQPSNHKSENPYTPDRHAYQYLLDHSLKESPAVKKIREATLLHPMAKMQAAPDESQFLALLLKMLNAKKVIEVGVFTGYTTLVLAEALPDDGKVLALDVSEEYVAVGKPYWAESSSGKKIDLRLAPGVDTLDSELASGAEGTYDFAFIDADKVNYDAYYERCLRLLRPGGLIGVDNTLWGGRVARPDIVDPDTVAIRTLNAKISSDDRVEIAFLRIADGLTLCRKK